MRDLLFKSMIYLDLYYGKTNYFRPIRGNILMTEFYWLWSSLFTWVNFIQKKLNSLELVLKEAWLFHHFSNFIELLLTTQSNSVESRNACYPEKEWQELCMIRDWSCIYHGWCSILMPVGVTPDESQWFSPSPYGLMAPLLEITAL